MSSVHVLYVIFSIIRGMDISSDSIYCSVSHPRPTIYVHCTIIDKIRQWTF